jgi:prepilin-type N-terminal cleavage/methylation domain-containing protein
MEDVSMKKRGFTLMELLIVIAIIGILISISVASYGSAQKKGRDARRHGDMNALRNAWDQYYADNNGNYPSGSACGWVLNPAPGVNIGPAYLPGGYPVDPKSGAEYRLTVGWRACSASSYCMCAGLEGETNTKVDCVGNPAPTGFVGLDCVENLQ